MFVVIFVSFLALLFAIFDSLRSLKGGLKTAFIIITILSCLRYDFGNDYLGYMKEFNEMFSYSPDAIMNYDGFKDKGWFIIQHYLYPIGWFLFAGIISVFCNVTYYKLIKRYVPRKDYWLSFFIYVFTFDMFVLQQSMVRQGLAIAIIVWAFMLLDKPKHNIGSILKILLITGLAVSIHKSAAFTVPFMLLRIIPPKWNKITAIVLMGCFFALFFVKTFLAGAMVNIMMLDAFSSFDYYSDEEGADIGIRALLECIPFFVSALYIYRNGENTNGRFIVIASMCATMILPLTTIVHLVSRVAMYFSILFIVSVPLTYRSIRIPAFRVCLLALLMAIQLYVYVDRFNSPTYKKSFQEYHTILSAF